MAKTNGFTAEQFIKAIPGTGGVITTIAQRVGCAWNTAKKYITDYPTIAQAYQNESERITDAARSVIISDIVKKKRVETAKWWLLHKAKDEFASRQEVVGKDGDSAITIRIIGSDGS